MILPTNDLIREVLGDNHPIPFGWYILLQPYNLGDKFLDAEGNPSLLERPDSAKDRDATQLGIGRVLMIGDSCFMAEQFIDCSFQPEVGDYVGYPKFNDIPKQWAGKNITYIKDYQIVEIMKDPSQGGYFHF